MQGDITSPNFINLFQDSIHYDLTVLFGEILSSFLNPKLQEQGFSNIKYLAHNITDYIIVDALSHFEWFDVSKKGQILYIYDNLPPQYFYSKIELFNLFNKYNLSIVEEKTVVINSEGFEKTYYVLKANKGLNEKYLNELGTNLKPSYEYTKLETQKKEKYSIYKFIFDSFNKNTNKNEPIILFCTIINMFLDNPEYKNLLSFDKQKVNILKIDFDSYNDYLTNENRAKITNSFDVFNIFSTIINIINKEFVSKDLCDAIFMSAKKENTNDHRRLNLYKNYVKNNLPKDFGFFDILTSEEEIGTEYEDEDKIILAKNYLINLPSIEGRHGEYNFWHWLSYIKN